MADEKTVRVRATKPGNYGSYRHEGDEFDVVLGPDDELGSWMEEIKTRGKPGPKPKAKPEGDE